MATQPRDHAKMKHGMSTSRRQQPSLIQRSNKWVKPTIASIYGPNNDATLRRLEYHCGGCKDPWCWCQHC